MQYHYHHRVDESGTTETEINVNASSLETILRASAIEDAIGFSVDANGSSQDADPETCQQGSHCNGNTMSVESESSFGDFLVAMLIVAFSLVGIFQEVPNSAFASWVGFFLTIAWAIRKLYLGFIAKKPYAGALRMLGTLALTLIVILLGAFVITVFRNN